MPGFVYMLASKGSPDTYIGFTTDPQKRVRKHNTGKGGKYTRRHSDWFVAALVSGFILTSARSFEARWKKSKLSIKKTPKEWPLKLRRLKALVNGWPENLTISLAPVAPVT